MMIDLPNGPSAMQYHYAGLFVSDDEWIHPTRVIDTYELILVTQGQVCLYEADANYQLHAGDLMLLRPFTQHGGTRPSFVRTSFFWAHFSCGALELLGLRAGPASCAEPDRLTSAFRCLLHVANTPGYPPYAAEAAMASLLAEVSAAQSAFSADTSRLIHEIAEWIRINSEKRLTVQTVAAQFSYHPDYLCTLMRRNFGKGLKEYINDERMKLLKTLLLTTDLSIKELAARMHFDTEDRLTHYFKYHEGISPARFRNQYVHTHLNRQ